MRTKHFLIETEDEDKGVRLSEPLNRKGTESGPDGDMSVNKEDYCNKVYFKSEMKMF